MVGDVAADFSAWATRQYGQIVGPIRTALDSSSRSALAQRANLGRSAVNALFEGRSWPHFQTVVRMAALAGVELFGLAARDLVLRGPELPPEEQALLHAYRQLPPADRRTVLARAVSTAPLRGGEAAQGSPQADAEPPH